MSPQKPSKEELDKLAEKKRVKELEVFNIKKAEEEKQLAQQKGFEPQLMDNDLVDENEDYSFELTGKDAQIVIEAYKAKFNRDPVPSPEGSDVLVFESLEQAQLFFGELAAAKNSFLCMERNKGVNGHNFFSCGDGNLYQGSIKEIMNGLRSASLAEPNNKYVEEGLKYLSSKFPALNPANTFRGVVNEIKPDEPASTAPRPKNSPI